MAKPAVPPTATVDEVRALLARYRCPVPFHEVRFLGNIASPGMGVSPIKVVESLWGAKLPEFETIDAAKELVRSFHYPNRQGVEAESISADLRVRA
jgi:hypothetical protein